MPDAGSPRPEGGRDHVAKLGTAGRTALCAALWFLPVLLPAERGEIREGIANGWRPLLEAGADLRRVVEAPGIEPGSEAASRGTSTSVVPVLVSPGGALGPGSVPASLGGCPARRRGATGRRDHWY
jgi:hypothetical protein